MARGRRLVDALRGRDHRNGKAFTSGPQQQEYVGDHSLGDVIPLPIDQYPEDQRGDACEPLPLSRDGLHTSKKPEPGILLATVKPEQVAWLWSSRIPLAKLTILDGDPGLGKSVLTMDLAARVTRGFAMPDGTNGVRGGVVILNAEDGLADTVVPRLLAAGADLERVLALNVLPDGDSERVVCLPFNLPELKAAVRRMSALFVVIDPIMAFLGGEVNTHRDQDCRRALHPLAKLAEQTGAAVLAIRHLTKALGGNPLYRGGGSIGIIGAARSGLLVAKDPDNPDRRILASTKCNLAKLPASLAFGLSPTEDGALRVGWMGESTHTAESLLAGPGDSDERDAIQDAMEVLRTILAGGRVQAGLIKRDARKAGIAERTLLRAKAALGVRSRLVGFGKDGEWHWEMPEMARDCQE